MMKYREDRNYIQAYSYISSAKENIGQIRSILYEVFITNKFSNDNFIEAKENINLYNASTLRFKETLHEHHEFISFYKNSVENETLKETFMTIESALENKDSDKFNIQPEYWFDKSTQMANLLKQTEDRLFNEVNISIDKKIKNANNTIALIVILLSLVLIALTFLMRNIINKILYSAHVFNKEFENSMSLLEQYKSTVDRSFIVSKTDPQGVTTYVNDEFCNISGYSKEELIGKPHNIIRHPDMQKSFFEEMWYTLRELKKPWVGEIQNRKKDGTSYWVKAMISPILDSSGKITEFIGVRTDITRIKNALITDFLTGYRNRFQLNEDIKKLNTPFIAIFNIDNFRQINDFYGHQFGDLIIKFIADKIYTNVKKEKYLRFYRLQGDEFIVLAENFSKELMIKTVKNILDVIKEKFVIQHEEILISCSCGISFEDKNLLSTANMALKAAKKSSVEFFVYDESISLNREYENNIYWTKKLSNTIKDDNIRAYYQPIVNNTTLVYEKYECLVRMIDEDNIIAPFFFLDIAKRTRQYFHITKTVIYEAFEMFKDKEVDFSINLSIMDILDNQISEYILMMLEKYDIGSRVVFEIVESEYIENFEGVLSFVNEVKKYNAKIAIDDFGTGYSNFGYFIKIKADYLKIDGSLIKNIDTDRSAFLIVSTIVEFSKKLGMKTIAEYVENEKIFKVVKEMGIDYSQGHYFSAPNKGL